MARLSFKDHPREFQDNHYIYPVLSRRSRGLSIGINLNPDKRCNFDCSYCQVDRQNMGPVQQVDRQALIKELNPWAAATANGELLSSDLFDGVDDSLKRINDFAMAGDGEPTMIPHFKEMVRDIIDCLKQAGVENVSLNLITNATLFQRPEVDKALQMIHDFGGEIWAKLDTGTEEAHARVARSSFPLSKIVDNIKACALKRPVVLQSLFQTEHGQEPSVEECQAWRKHLLDFKEAGCKIQKVQIYTVARQPAESFVGPVSSGFLENLAEAVQSKTRFAVEVFQ